MTDPSGAATPSAAPSIKGPISPGEATASPREASAGGTRPPAASVVSEVRGLLEARRRELEGSLAAGEDGMALGRRNAASLDTLIEAVYRHAASGAPEGVAVVAVGSHGRGAVAFQSDADLRILVPSKARESEVSAFAEALLYPLWDAGVAIGHQVTGQAELLELAQNDLAS